MLGAWTTCLQTLRHTFSEATPFPHVVIDDFLEDNLARKVADAFPSPGASWFFYNNPIEVKYTLKDFSNLPIIASVFSMLQSDDMIEKIQQICDIPNIETDPHLHGAGLHYHPRGGKLDMHLDYSIHPLSGKERRLNLILYLNPAWREEYGGHLELWNSAFTQCQQKILPRFNRAVIFQTSDISYHGMPHPITCPADTGRQSLAIYYVSPPRENVAHRPKASFRPLPDQTVSIGLQTLYELRSSRRLTSEDVQKHVPEFKSPAC
jgi:hypothetical protein